MKILKRHLSVANILSLTALFVALAGSAYAAGKIGPSAVKSQNIAKEAVTNQKLKSGSVTSGKIKNGAVTAGKLAKASVINSKLASKAVTNAKLGTEAVSTSKLAKKAITDSILAPEAVSAGKLGTGSVSATKLSPSFYLQLLKNVTYVTETSVNDSETEKSVAATCPVGKEVLGGGARINSPASVNVAVSASYPLVTATNSRAGWIATGRETPIEPGTWQIVAYAICAEL